MDKQLTLWGGYSLDALQCYPALLETIAEKGDICLVHVYLVQVCLVQVISNEEKLLEDSEQIAQQLACKQAFQTIDKTHGRLEQRPARVYELNLECLEPRWHKTAIQPLVVIDRQACP